MERRLNANLCRRPTKYRNWRWLPSSHSNCQGIPHSTLRYMNIKAQQLGCTSLAAAPVVTDEPTTNLPNEANHYPSDGDATEFQDEDVPSNSSESVANKNLNLQDQRANADINWQNPLFETLISPGLDISHGQILSLIYAYYLRHNLSKAALTDFLQILKLIIPNFAHDSLYLFEQVTNLRECNASVHYYCHSCQIYLGLSNGTAATISCESCENEYNLVELEKCGNYFLVSDIESQLKVMLETTSIWEIIIHNKHRGLMTEEFANNMSEVYSGWEYRQGACREFLLHPDNFSMNFDTDGVRLFRSSKTVIWPLFACFNELNFNQKREFSVMQSLWFGDHKPNIEVFLTPFIEEANKLYREGFLWVDKFGIQHKSRVIFPILTADAPARAALMNFVQFNGYFGCGMCENRGERVEKGAGHVIVYPLCWPFPSQRTQQRTFIHAETAEERGRPTFGVKGRTVLNLLPKFNIIKGVVPDHMHAVLLGVVRQFTATWVTPSDEDFYIRDTSSIDACIADSHFPDEIRRRLRPLTHRQYWKASELRSWLMFVSPIALQHILPRRYYNHWLLLVNAMRMLYKSSITSHQLDDVRILLMAFIYQTETLYGKCHVSYNVHLLSHIPDYVKLWGAPWAYSAFIFEDLGGMVKKMCKNGNRPEKQIFSSFIARQSLRNFAESHIPLANENIQDLYETFDAPVMNKSVGHVMPLRGVGAGELVVPSDEYVRAVNALLYPSGNRSLNCCNAISWQRLSINGKLYCTEQYCAKFLRNNSVVQLINGDVMVIHKIYLLDLECLCSPKRPNLLLLPAPNEEIHCSLLSTNGLLNAPNSGQKFFVFGRLLTAPVRMRNVIHPETGINLVRFVQLVTQVDPPNIVAIPSENVKFKCVQIIQRNKQFVIVNDLRYELD